MGEAYLFNNENGTPKSLWGLLVKPRLTVYDPGPTGPLRFIESHNRTVIRLLSRDYKTPIKRLQDSYQEITRLLSRDYKTPINLL